MDGTNVSKLEFLAGGIGGVNGGFLRTVVVRPNNAKGRLQPQPHQPASRKEVQRPQRTHLRRSLRSARDNAGPKRGTRRLSPLAFKKPRNPPLDLRNPPQLALPDREHLPTQRP